MENKIFSDAEVFEQIKPVSRRAYVKCWKGFKDLAGEFNFEAGPPGECLIVNYFRDLRFEKKVASSTMWTFYSYLNSILKRKYGFKLQELPRVTLFIKGLEVDMKKKAPIWDAGKLKKFLVAEMPTPYWEVRQSIVMMAFFGGLRLQETCDLELEKIIRGPEGYTITHMRCKQRDDKTFTKFVVPQEGGYADRLAVYIKKVNDDLQKFQGRVWFTCTPKALKKQGMGLNMVGQVPHEVAKYLHFPEPETYTFHSFRRTSATTAADAGSTTEQMVDFFGWKNGSMCQEYISTSKPAILGMASKLGAFEQVLSQDPVVEVDVQIEEAPEVDNKIEKAPEVANIMEEFIVLEEDPEMYAMAGIEPVPVQCTVDATIRQAMASMPAVSGNNVNFKIIVLNGQNSGHFSFA